MDGYFSAHCLNQDKLTGHVRVLECQPVKRYFPQNEWVPLLRVALISFTLLQQEVIVFVHPT